MRAVSAAVAYGGKSRVENKNFHKDVFERISDDKRGRIFGSAMKEFASEGYFAANINTIASNADISIGAMYTYFPSKENLFLAISEYGIGIFHEILADLKAPAGFFETVERLFHLTVRYARRNVDISRMYLELTTQQLLDLAARLAEKMEIDFREFYTALLKGAVEKGEIRADVNIGFAAKFLDDLVLSLQLENSVYYYESRLRQYVGEDMSDTDIIAGLMDVVRRYFLP